MECLHRLDTLLGQLLPDFLQELPGPRRNGNINNNNINKLVILIPIPILILILITTIAIAIMLLLIVVIILLILMIIHSPALRWLRPRPRLRLPRRLTLWPCKRNGSAPEAGEARCHKRRMPKAPNTMMLHVSRYVHTCVYIYEHIHMYIYIYICICTHLSLYIYICIYVCI